MRGPENALKMAEEPQGAHHSRVRRPRATWQTRGSRAALSSTPRTSNITFPWILSVLTNKTEYFLCSLWLCLLKTKSLLWTFYYQDEHSALHLTKTVGALLQMLFSLFLPYVYRLSSATALIFLSLWRNPVILLSACSHLNNKFPEINNKVILLWIS